MVVDDARFSRQRGGASNGVALDIGTIAAAGQRCIDKVCVCVCGSGERRKGLKKKRDKGRTRGSLRVLQVVTVEETEYDEVINCKHSYTERCHITYKTDYDPQQEEECDENYKKNCYIEYKKVAVKEPVQFCFQPLVRNCNIPGPVECTTEYQSECTTR